MATKFQLNQGATVAPDNTSYLGFTVGGGVITYTDTTGGAAPNTRLWEIISWPGPLSGPPSLTTTTGSTGTFPVASSDGCYIVRLTRNDGGVITTRTLVAGVQDADGLVLPSPGQTGLMMNVGAIAGDQAKSQQMGWAGGVYAGTQSQLDQYLRFNKGVVAPTPSTNVRRDASGYVKAVGVDSGAVADLVFRRNGTNILSMSATQLIFDKAVVAPVLMQTAQSTDTACFDLTLIPQAPFATATGTNRDPGNLVASLPDPTNGSTTRPLFKVKTLGGNTWAQMGRYDQGSSVYGAAYFGNITAGQTNFAFLGDGTSIVYLNTPGGGTIELSIAGVAGTGVTISSTLTIIQNQFTQFGPTSGNPASAGTCRFPNAASQRWRNAGNTADVLGISVSASNQVLVGDANASEVKFQATGNITLVASTAIQLGISNYATTGYLRGQSTVNWVNRNQGNTADIVVIGTNASNVITIGGDANNAGILMTFGSATNTLSMQVSGGSVVANTGFIKLPAPASTEYLIAHRNFGNTADIVIAAWDTNGNVWFGTNTSNASQAAHVRIASSADVKIASTTNIRFTADGTGISFFNVASVAQQADIVAITDSTGGAVSNTFAAITAGASYAQADMTACKNALASTASKLNSIRTVFRNYGLMA